MKTIKIEGESFSVGKIICVGRNYTEHIKELNNDLNQKPVLFLKPASSMIFDKMEIEHPNYSSDLHYETELVLVIDKLLKNADLSQAENAIFGYGVGLDMTLRDIQNNLKSKGNPWTIAKCFDTSAVVSEFIPKSKYQLTLNELLTLKVNNEVKQYEQLNKMIFKPNQIVSYISSFMTIEPGDIIFTGTPSGVGKVIKGDILEASIENIGTLTSRIA